MDTLEIETTELERARAALERTPADSSDYAFAIHRLAVAWYTARRAMGIGVEHRRHPGRWAADHVLLPHAPKPQSRSASAEAGSASSSEGGESP